MPCTDSTNLGVMSDAKIPQNNGTLCAGWTIPSRWRHWVCRRWMWLALGWCLWMGVSTAQVATTITPDGTLGTEVTPNGNVYEITHGTRPGGGANLFHSFDRFDVGTGDIAHFMSDTGVDNIIGRVTGSDMSMIDGTLQSDANLFLLNPQGILFGENATLDVNGSFHASTADALHFADGATFSTQLSDTTTLTVAAPSTFGFLSDQPAGIEVQNSQLTVPEGEALSLVGGDITITGDGDSRSGRQNLSAPSGQIHIVGVGSSGTVAFDATRQRPTLDMSAFEALGDMVIQHGAHLDVSDLPDNGQGSGTVVIRGRRLRIEQSRIVADTHGSVDGAEVGVDIEVRDEFVLTHEGRIITNAIGTGHGADVSVRATEVVLEEASVIFAETFSEEAEAGAAGKILVEAERIRLTGGSLLISRTFGHGHGGTVTVRAKELTFETSRDDAFRSGIVAISESTSAGAGNAGNILIEAEQLSLSGGSLIVSITVGPGHGGTILIVSEQVSLSGGSLIGSDASGPGHGGTILIEAGRLHLSSGAEILSLNGGSGQGGAITVFVEEIFLDGEQSGIIAQSQGEGAGSGDGGAIVIEAELVRLSGDSQVTSTTFGPGHGGMMTVRAEEVIMDERAVIFVLSAQMVEGAGDSGAILIEANRVNLSDEAKIVSITLGPGHGGAVTVRAEDVTFEGITSNTSGIVVSTQGTGDASDILLEAEALTLADDATISSFTFGPGQGGDITLNVGRLALLRGRNVAAGVSQELGELPGAGTGTGGHVTVIAQESIHLIGADAQGIPSALISFSQGIGEPGPIKLVASTIVLDGGLFGSQPLGLGRTADVEIEVERLILTNSGAILSVTDSENPAGTITINATDTVILSNGGFILAVTLGAGNAGSVIMHVDHLLLTEGSQINGSTAGLGDAGTVSITATGIISIAGSSSGIFTNTVSGGSGGDIELQARQLQLTDEAMISSDSSGFSDAGNIRIGAQDIDLRHNSAITTSVAQGGGHGGNIHIGGEINDHGDIIESADRLNLNASRITASTDGGDGGNIAIGARQVVLDQGSMMSANTGGGLG